MSERAKLRFELETESNRRVALEKQVSAGQLRIDMPAASTSSGVSSRRDSAHSSSSQFRHVTELLKTNARRPPPWLLQIANVVDDLIGLLDRAALTAGRHMRVHRALRLAAIGYLFMLHCWLLVLLVSMIPSVEQHQQRSDSSHGHAHSL